MNQEAKLIKFLFFKPYLRQTVWGGTNLKSIYSTNLENIGEAWLISAYPNCSSICLNPEFFNCSLEQIYQQHQYLFANYQQPYPNLIKLIDTVDDLSIQIHPNDQYAQKHYQSYGKNEFWYVLANNGNPFLIDYCENDCQTVLNKLKNHDFTNLFAYVNLIKDQSIYIPAGTIHAIPAKTMVFEIQQSSDLTFRIYDYDRTYNQQKRQLHLKEAIDCLIPKQKRIIYQPNDTKLINNQYFCLEKIIASKEYQKIKFQNFAWLEIVVISGQGYIDQYPIKTGDALIMTNLFENSFDLKGDAVILVNTVRQ
ncbi:Mannose-6-phosphate isomerase type I, catalytic domain-containing protein [[Mycoplasma] cavipharyngis]|uniref:type I phosphomannose isomerase catalytic subunit n=1 Tax=[Mycoplasma] cavipharyngis TaxID=92757 RepID=UPI0037047560